MKIVFGMPDTEYHAINAFSGSGAKEMLVSPLDFWWQSWMNPDREERKDTKAMLYGRAFHVAVLEGKEAFNSRYAEMPEPIDYPNHLKNSTQMREILLSIGLKKSGTLKEMKQRLIETGSDFLFFDDVVAEKTAGKEALSKDDFEQIEIRCKAVHENPYIKDSVKGGAAEVSVFWDEVTDYGTVPMKSRFDYLNAKTGFIVDVKTFQNSTRKKLDESAMITIGLYRYHLSAALYLNALKKLTTTDNLIVEGNPPEGFIDDLAKIKTPRFAWLFVQNHGAPNSLIREFREFENYHGNSKIQNLYFRAGDDGWKYAVREFAYHMGKFGTDQPWVSEEKPIALTDDHLPKYIQNGLI